MRWPNTRSFILSILAGMAVLAGTSAAQEPDLTKEQIKEFLLNAKVIRSRQTSKGITVPWRLTLREGTLEHDAAFQTVNQHKTMMPTRFGMELNFIDSYRYDIGAYLLAEMIGMDDMLPVTVEREWRGKHGALSWWLPVAMDDQERMDRHISPPDIEAWNRQLYRVRVFNQLIFDTDFNRTNLLISKDWKVWRIDFTRAFRLYKKLMEPDELIQCDRQLLEKLKQLDGQEFKRRSKRYLRDAEIEAVMARRDLIVEHFEKLVAEKGESAVLY